MKEQQLNLNGRKELGKLEMTKEVVYTLNVCVWIFFHVTLYTIYREHWV